MDFCLSLFAQHFHLAFLPVFFTRPLYHSFPLDFGLYFSAQFSPEFSSWVVGMTYLESLSTWHFYLILCWVFPLEFCACTFHLNFFLSKFCPLFLPIFFNPVCLPGFLRWPQWPDILLDFLMQAFRPTFSSSIFTRIFNPILYCTFYQDFAFNFLCLYFLPENFF